MDQGFPPEAPWVVFDYNLFLVESALTPIQEQYNEIIDTLTKWQPIRNTRGVLNKAPVKVTGADHEEALARAHYMSLRKNWGDGLAIFPPTKSRVDLILAGTDHNSDELGTGRKLPNCPWSQTTRCSLAWRTG
ncbi:MAG: hypothetical protein P8Z37_09910 [Acidobacteriota bacterium]